MTKAEQLFEDILDEFINEDKVTFGKMMSSPALKADGKVFAFFHKEEMTFKLGKDFNPDDYGLEEWSFLSPFKNKPPMKAWFAVPYSQYKSWKPLTQLALNNFPIFGGA